MSDDPRNANGLTDDQLGRAFRGLADEYSQVGDAQNDETWAKIEALSAAEPVVRLVPRDGSHRTSLRAAILAAAACLLAVWGVWALRGEQPMAFVIDGGEQRSVSESGEGNLIAAEDKALVVVFSDATRVTLSPHSTLRVSADKGRRVLAARLAQGRVEVHMSPEPRSKLELHAGAYTLRPIGATFAFGYVPGDHQLDVMTKTGVVLVREAEGSEHRVTPGRPLRLPREHEVDTPDKKAAADLGSGRPVVDVGTKSTGGALHEPTFQSLAAGGKFSQIVQLAKRRGLDRVLATGSASDLQELGQAARYTGDLALASRTWTTMTKRFPGTSGQNARFFLGRLAEQQGNGTSALAYYDAYLRGAGGVYTAEALGRKLSIVNKSHGAQQARPIAREYLRRFPQGPFARAARELVGGE